MKLLTTLLIIAPILGSIAAVSERQQIAEYASGRNLGGEKGKRGYELDLSDSLVTCGRYCYSLGASALSGLDNNPARTEVDTAKWLVLDLKDDIAVGLVTVVTRDEGDQFTYGGVSHEAGRAFSLNLVADCRLNSDPDSLMLIRGESDCQNADIESGSSLNYWSDSEAYTIDGKKYRLHHYSYYNMSMYRESTSGNFRHKHHIARLIKIKVWRDVHIVAVLAKATWVDMENLTTWVDHAKVHSSAGVNIATGDWIKGTVQEIVSTGRSYGTTYKSVNIVDDEMPIKKCIGRLFDGYRASDKNSNAKERLSVTFSRSDEAYEIPLERGNGGEGNICAVRLWFSGRQRDLLKRASISGARVSLHLESGGNRAEVVLDASKLLEPMFYGRVDLATDSDRLKFWFKLDEVTLYVDEMAVITGCPSDTRQTYKDAANTKRPRTTAATVARGRTSTAKSMESLFAGIMLRLCGGLAHDDVGGAPPIEKDTDDVMSVMTLIRFKFPNVDKIALSRKLVELHKAENKGGASTAGSERDAVEEDNVVDVNAEGNRIASRMENDEVTTSSDAVPSVTVSVVTLLSTALFHRVL